MMERNIETKDWSIRVNSSMLAMCIVDSCMLYSGVQEGDCQQMTQREFYETLATELIDNRYDFPRTCNYRDREGTRERFSSLSSGIEVHLPPTKQKKKTKEGELTRFTVQNNCVICKKMKAVLICSGCRDNDSCTVWICGTKTGRNCFEQHLSDRY